VAPDGCWGCRGQFKRRAERRGQEQLVGGRVDRKWQALDPAVIASRGANAFWQKLSVRVVTAK